MPQRLFEGSATLKQSSAIVVITHWVSCEQSRNPGEKLQCRDVRPQPSTDKTRCLCSIKCTPNKDGWAYLGFQSESCSTTAVMEGRSVPRPHDLVLISTTPALHNTTHSLQQTHDETTRLQESSRLSSIQTRYVSEALCGSNKRSGVGPAHPVIF